MDAYRIVVWIHVVCAVLLTGLALYGLIMLVALRRRFPPPEAQRLLQFAQDHARWPHVIVPPKFRLSLPWVGALLLAALAVTGLLALSWRSLGGVWWWIKLALVGALVLVHAVLLRRSAPWAVRLNFILALGILVVSAWIIR